MTISIESDEPIELHVHGYDVEREMLPMLVLMVPYTVSSLWILAQPNVE